MNDTFDSSGADHINVRSGEVRPRHYYIAAEEITWNYGIGKPHQLFDNEYESRVLSEIHSSVKLDNEHRTSHITTANYKYKQQY